MNPTRGSGVRGLAVRWTLLSALGLAAGQALGLGLSGPIEALVGMVLVTPVMLALAGTVFGASQWLATRGRLREGLRWVAASALALAIGMTAGIVLVEVAGQAITGEPMRLFALGPLGRVAGLATIGTLTGLAVGTAQWLVTRRYGVRARGWVVRCTAAFGLGLPGGSLVAELLVGGLASPAGFVIFLLASGLVVGAATARVAPLAAASTAD